jgi:hypothetical protein
LDGEKLGTLESLAENTHIRRAESPQVKLVEGSRKRKRRSIANMTIEEAERAIQKQLPALIDRLTDLAMGVLVAVIEPHERENPETGEIEVVPEQRIYRLQPDKDALKYLTERVLGRVPQRVELKGTVDNTFTVIPWMPRDAAEEKKLVRPLTKRDVDVLPSPVRVLEGPQREAAMEPIRESMTEPEVVEATVKEVAVTSDDDVDPFVKELVKRAQKKKR